MGSDLTLKLHNTLTRTKEDFVPLDPSNVRMYVCGPTVYDFAHIGNARPAIVFDVLFRLLRHVYGADHVTYVRNITDVDDKINARAARDYPDLPLNEAIRKVTETTAAQYQKDTTALGCLQPTVQPRATENIAEMQRLIGSLQQRGHAYEAAGEVLFAVETMPDYGALSGRDLSQNLAGARVEVEAHKKNPADFVLWKLSSANEPGWDSPWGRGRPGWHIECSAMSERYLGSISSSRTMRTKSRNRAAPTAPKRWRATGCTTASSRSRGRRCPSRWATSSPSTSCSRPTSSEAATGRVKCSALRC